METKRFFALTCCCLFIFSAQAADRSSSWLKGNLHTHSFWSDGDDFPEMIVAWYQEHGYDFLAISDHNVLHERERWLTVGTNQVRRVALEKYLGRFGTNWVVIRGEGPSLQVLLKPLAAYRTLFEKGKFLLIQSEEISDSFENIPVHLNASNLREYIAPQGGKNVREVMQNNVNAVLDQARATGSAILPHLNHPNFGWAITAEDLAAVEGEHFFEVYNGHPSVHNEGDAKRASTDQMWDVALTIRLTSSKPEPLFGLATDDTHNYHRHGVGHSNGGRGWIMVRSDALTPENILKAMAKGDFYASTGVVLRDVLREGGKLALTIAPEAGVTYRTKFIGTRRGVALNSEPVLDENGREMRTTRRYSPEIGQVLDEIEGSQAVYELKGDELYVRALVISSKSKANPSSPGEMERAWTQPIFRSSF